MNYSDTISQSIEFIEAHIKEELSIKEIATRAGYSVYHFCRIFTAATGRTVMDYIRYRRLSLARMELLKERKIIDVALDYGFETASGFTKAFHKEFGYSPTVYLARMNAWAVGNKGGNDLNSFERLLEHTDAEHIRVLEKQFKSNAKGQPCVYRPLH